CRGRPTQSSFPAMSLQRLNSYRPMGRGRRFSRVLPWIFVLVVAALALLPTRKWLHLPLPPWSDGRQEFETIWRPAGNLDRPRPADVVRTIDGDTFEARAHFVPG